MRLGYDDVGDPAGHPVVYLHGTPDSRLARHPDDSLVAAAGVRLLAVDRPGYGGTLALPAGMHRAAFADDIAQLLDSLEIAGAAVVAWSGGALDGLRLAAASALTGRVTSLTIVAGLVPREAYDDADVRASAPGRLALVEMAELVPADEVADTIASMLVPSPCDHALALEHQREQRTAVDQATVDGIPGAADRMADSLVEAVRHGLDGVRADLTDQVMPFVRETLTRVDVPVRLFYGTADEVTPVAFGEWYADHLPKAELHVVHDAGHYLPFTHWPEILSSAAVGKGPPG